MLSDNELHCHRTAADEELYDGGHGMLWAGGGLEGVAGSRYMEVYLKSAVL